MGGAGPRRCRVLGFIPSDVAAVLCLALESSSSNLLPWQGWRSALGKEDEDTESLPLLAPGEIPSVPGRSLGTGDGRGDG